MMNYRMTLPVAMVLMACASDAAAPPEISVEPLLETDTTILHQAFAYPAGRAKITSTILTVPPRATVALHLHPVPLFVYILEGEITVDYERRGKRTYRKGDAFVEAIEWPHHARNRGDENVRILTVYAAAVGLSNSIPLE